METNDINKLERIRIRSLSQEERSRSWSGIKTRLSSTPTLSPFTFPIHKAISFAAVFMLVIGTVSVSDTARPGQTLFPIDIAVERVASSIDPSSRVDHAHERLAEFDQTLESDAAQNDSGPQMPPAGQMEKAASPEADTVMMFATTEAPLLRPLSEDVEQIIEKTRHELEKILNDAAFKGDEETVIEIVAIIDAFETKVRMMREQ